MTLMNQPTAAAELHRQGGGGRAASTPLHDHFQPIANTYGLFSSDSHPPSHYGHRVGVPYGIPAKLRRTYDGFEACCVIGCCWMLHVGSSPESNSSRAGLARDRHCPRMSLWLL